MVVFVPFTISQFPARRPPVQQRNSVTFIFDDLQQLAAPWGSRQDNAAAQVTRLRVDTRALQAHELLDL